MYYDKLDRKGTKRMWRCNYCKKEYDCADRIDNNPIRIGNKIVALVCVGVCTEIVAKHLHSILSPTLVDTKA